MHIFPIKYIYVAEESHQGYSLVLTGVSILTNGSNSELVLFNCKMKLIYQNKRYICCWKTLDSKPLESKNPQDFHQEKYSFAFGVFVVLGIDFVLKLRTTRKTKQEWRCQEIVFYFILFYFMKLVIYVIAPFICWNIL